MLQPGCASNHVLSDPESDTTAEPRHQLKLHILLIMLHQSSFHRGNTTRRIIILWIYCTQYWLQNSVVLFIFQTEKCPPSWKTSCSPDKWGRMLPCCQQVSKPRRVKPSTRWSIISARSWWVFPTTCGIGKLFSIDKYLSWYCAWKFVFKGK